MRLPRKIAGLLMTAGMAAGITATAAPAHADPTRVVIFTTTPGTLLCLEGDPAPDFAYRVTTEPCNAANNQAQQWDIQDQGGGIVKVANHAISGWCIEANTIANGSPIPLWPCTSTESNLRWAWIHDELGHSQFQSRISGSTGHCLDVPMGQNLPGLWMRLYVRDLQRRRCGTCPAAYVPSGSTPRAGQAVPLCLLMLLPRPGPLPVTT